MKKIFALILSLVAGGICAQQASLLDQVPDVQETAKQQSSPVVETKALIPDKGVASKEAADTTKSVEEPIEEIATEPFADSHTVPMESIQEETANLVKSGTTDINSITKPLKISDEAENMPQEENPSATIKNTEGSDEIDTTILV